MKGVQTKVIGGEKRHYAFIKSKGQVIALGRYASPEEAHAAYCGAAKALFGDYAHNGIRPLLEIAKSA